MKRGFVATLIGVIAGLLVAGLLGLSSVSAQAGGAISIVDSSGHAVARVVTSTIAATDSGLAVYAQGAAANGNAVTANPLLMAGYDINGITRTIASTVSGDLFVEEQLSLSNESVAYVTSTASNGATAVSLVGALAGKRVHPVNAQFINIDNIGHIVKLLSGPSTVIYTMWVPAGQTTAPLIFGEVLLAETDLRGSFTVAGQALEFTSDAAAFANVFANVAYIQR